MTLDAKSWDKKRWAAVIVLVLGIELALLMRFSNSSPVVARPLQQNLSYALVSQPAAGSRLAASFAVNDPTLFALANPFGFSAEAWLRIAPWEHSLTGWTNAPYLLRASPSKLGLSFIRFLQTNSSPGSALAERTVAPALKLPMVSPALPTQSLVRIEGDLAQRPLIAPIPVPGIPYPDFLSNTVIQVMVDRAGRVLSHTLVAGSGSKQADQVALELAKAARFRAAVGDARSNTKQDNLTWGQLSFKWYSAGSTNSKGPVP